MFPYNHKEAVDCFLQAKNLNSSLKHLLKSEASRQDERTAKFAKAFRQVTKNVTPKKLEEFLLKALPSYEEHLYLLLRSSFAQQIDPILDKIIEDHAEAFNSSYSHDGSGQITIEDENKFLDHGKAALEYIRQAADGDSTLPPTGFIKNAIVFSLFDRTVLSALRSRLGDGYAD